MDIFKVTDDLQYRIDNLTFTEYDSIDLECFNDTMESLTGELEKRHKDIASIIKNLYFEFNELDKVILQLKIRNGKISQKIDALEAYLKDSLLKNNIKKIKFIEFDISLRESSFVVINDLDSLPTLYIKKEVITKPDKMLIKEHLKNNQKIKGAHLEKDYHLQIK